MHRGSTATAQLLCYGLVEFAHRLIAAVIAACASSREDHAVGGGGAWKGGGCHACTYLHALILFMQPCSMTAHRAHTWPATSTPTWHASPCIKAARWSGNNPHDSMQAHMQRRLPTYKHRCNHQLTRGYMSWGMRTYSAVKARPCKCTHWACASKQSRLPIRSGRACMRPRKHVGVHSLGVAVALPVAFRGLKAAIRAGSCVCCASQTEATCPGGAESVWPPLGPCLHFCMP